MLERLRNQIGTAGLIVAVVALVAALAGGAVAATGNKGGAKAAASAKAKQGPRGPKGAKGAPGPQGPAGPAGSAGAKGDTGAAGSNGSNGATGATGPAGPAGKEGKAGSPWTAGGTLPSGATETGMWDAYSRYIAVEGGPPFAPIANLPISFGVPLAEPIEEADFHFIRTAGEESTKCPGSVVEPLAEPGQMCLYMTPGGQTETILPVIFSQAGVTLIATPEAEEQDVSARGSWAVTAE